MVSQQTARLLLPAAAASGRGSLLGRRSSVTAGRPALPPAPSHADLPHTTFFKIVIYIPEQKYVAKIKHFKIM